MIDPTLEELLQREIDRENGPGDSAWLRQVMASRPDLQARHEAMQGVVRTLQEVEEVEPPPGMTDDILRLINQKRRSVPSRAGWLATLRSAFGRQPSLRYAFTFASGLALGALAAAVVDQSPFSRLDRPYFSGTILPDSRLGRLETVDRQRFTVEGVKGEATTKLGQDLVLVEIQIDASRPIDVSVEFDGNVFSPLGFERSEPSGTDVVLGGDRVRLRHAGEGRYRLALGVSQRVPTPLRLRLSGDGLAFERTLETRRGGS